MHINLFTVLGIATGLGWAFLGLMALAPFETKRGSVGGVTYQHGRFGTIARQRTFPVNPQTTYQQTARARQAAIAATWRTITEVQRLGWKNLARALGSRLSGFNLYCKVNGTLVLTGQDPIADAPSAPSAFAVIALSAFAADNSSNTLSVSVAVPAGADADCIFEATAPIPPGQEPEGTAFRFLTVDTMPEDATTPEALGPLYVARFGSMPVGYQIAVRVTPYSGGFRGVPFQISGFVVA